VNALKKKVENLFESLQKKIQNPNSNVRPVTWKEHTMTTRPPLLKSNFRLETEFNKNKLNLKAGSLKIYKTSK
jgi:hypothetical protein